MDLQKYKNRNEKPEIIKLFIYISLVLNRNGF